MKNTATNNLKNKDTHKTKTPSKLRNQGLLNILVMNNKCNMQINNLKCISYPTPLIFTYFHLF